MSKNTAETATGNVAKRASALTMTKLPATTTTTRPNKNPNTQILCQTACVDLNGDGKLDDIKYSRNKDGSSCVLKINDKSIKVGIDADGWMQSWANLRIVDIDSNDLYLELSLTRSEYESQSTAFYYYNGDDIRSMGLIPGEDWGDFRLYKIDGSGVMYSPSGSEFLCTWSYPEKYRLTKQHQLKKVPQDLYEMNYSVKVKKSLALQVSRTDHRTKLVLIPGETVKLIGSDKRKWVLVENSSGVKGWFGATEKDEIVGTNIDVYDVFDGLVHAN
jgi:hypothetical protein